MHGLNCKYDPKYGEIVNSSHRGAHWVTLANRVREPVAGAAVAALRSQKQPPPARKPQPAAALKPGPKSRSGKAVKVHTLLQKELFVTSNAVGTRVLLAVSIDAVAPSRLPGLLHRAGCTLTLLGPPGLAVAASRYVSRHIVTERGPEAISAELRRLAEAPAEHDLTILATEPLVLEVARHADQAWAQGLLPSVTPQVAAGLFNSKFALLHLLRDHIEVPEYVLAADATEVRRAADGFGYPVILRAGASMAGSGIGLAYSAETLEASYSHIRQFPVAVQRYVDGRVGSTEVLFDRGRPMAWSSSYAVAFWPNRLSASCVRQPMDHADIEPMLGHVGRITGFDGLAGIDWIQGDGASHLSFLELNPRPSTGYHLGGRSRIDYPAALRHWLREQFEPQRPVLADERPCPLFPESLYRAIETRSPALFMHGLRNAPGDDPVLVLAHTRRLLGHFVSVALKRGGRG
jgi:glutathione synthase/RimK-type ligase-like ATP-grasp enzyme